jgi:hypothetical protein
MQLHLFHGRTTPDESLQDWGFDGPTINEITSLTGTYGELYVHFENEQHLYKAQKQTGWDIFGDFALALRFQEDLLQTADGYFGDWELIQS